MEHCVWLRGLRSSRMAGRVLVVQWPACRTC